jgi:hypothetical protein
MSTETQGKGPFIGPHLAFEPAPTASYDWVYRALNSAIDQPDRPEDMHTSYIESKFGTPKRLYGTRLDNVNTNMLSDILKIYQEATGYRGITLDYLLNYPHILDKQVHRLIYGKRPEEMKFHSKFGYDTSSWFQGHFLIDKHRVSADAKSHENLYTFRFWVFKGHDGNPLPPETTQEIQDWEDGINTQIEDYLVQKGIGVPFTQFN